MFFKKINEIYNGLIGSFDNVKDSGFSARKLTAFTIIGMIGWLHYAHITPEVVTTIVMYDEIFASFLLGLITTEQIIKFKGGSSEVTDKPNENIIEQN